MTADRDSPGRGAVLTTGSGPASAPWARIVYSRLYLCVDVLWLAVEQSAVLVCAEQLFPALASQRPVAGLAALLSGCLWLVISRRSPVGERGASEVAHAVAARGALASLILRTLLVMATTAGLGLWASLRESVLPLSAVAFLLWAAAVATPLFDAGRALLEYQGALQILDESRRRAAAGSGAVHALHSLAGQLERDTLPTRALLVGLTVLGVCVAAVLPLFTLALSALPSADTSRLLPLLFAAPALLLICLGLGLLHIYVRLQLFSHRAATADSGLHVPGMLWLPRGVAGTTLFVGLLLLAGVAGYARVQLAVSPLALVVLAAICVSGLSATAIAQWALVRLLIDRLRQRQVPGVVAAPAPRRVSEAAALYKARRAIGWATVAVLTPPLVALCALWLRQWRVPVTWQVALLFAAAAVGGLAWLTTLLRLRSSLRPLTEATRQAGALAAAPDEASASPEQRTDAGRRRTRLAQTLQAMQDALRQRLVSSSQAQARLETEVAERTRELLQRNLDIEQNIRLLSEAQAALSEAEKLAAIGQFVAGIAHEINNPINAALNAARPLREALSEVQPDLLSPEQCADQLRDADLAAMLRVLRRGTQRAEEIVRALFRYTDQDAQAQVAIDVHRTLDDAWEILQHPGKTRVQVQRSDGACQRVLSHGGQLQQVFLNLLGNAVFALAECQAARPDFVPILEITTVDAGDAVHITIRDNGPGIPRALQGRIFEPFYTTKDPTQGSGLGLAIAHSIVVRHHGRIELSSAPGQGARFVVILPAAAGEGATSERS